MARQSQIAREALSSTVGKLPCGIGGIDGALARPGSERR